MYGINIYLILSLLLILHPENPPFSLLLLSLYRSVVKFINVEPFFFLLSLSSGTNSTIYPYLVKILKFIFSFLLFFFRELIMLGRIKPGFFLAPSFSLYLIASASNRVSWTRPSFLRHLETNFHGNLLRARTGNFIQFPSASFLLILLLRLPKYFDEIKSDCLYYLFLPLSCLRFSFPRIFLCYTRKAKTMKTYNIFIP